VAETSLPAMPDGAMVAAPLADSGQASWRARLSGYLQEPALRRALPALVAVGALAVLAALYLLIAQGPQRMLYSSLGDAERARVVETLEAGGIAYSIDNTTGALSVSEDDVYRARMLVASDAGLAAPEGASEMLDAIPLGSSRTLEGERLRLARERELMLTIREIDGIEAVRVHLATPERSVFVRESNPPSASVMVRLASGRSLGQSQVEAIVSLVSGSVPGMTSDTVRVVDQNGRLLSSPREDHHAGLVLQREFEAKLQEQLASLLMPLLGDGNFSSQVQVELDRDETTAAREVYDAEGAVRSESERSAVRMAGQGVGGIPGVTANTPPPEPELVDEPPAEGLAEVDAARDRETATQRNYELGREVAVTSSQPGGVVKLSVAVALDAAALEAAAPLTAQQVQSLVSAAVGAQQARGDTVEVVVSAFEASEMEAPPFYELPWFAALMRILAALIAVLLVLLIAVRPLLKRLNTKTGKENVSETGTGQENAAPLEQLGADGAEAAVEDETDTFTRKVELARQLASTQPDRAVEALQRMLEVPSANGNGQPAS
jgi:flagellar M-ring protein FliF